MLRRLCLAFAIVVQLLAGLSPVQAGGLINSYRFGPATDANFSSTVLLLSGDGANASTTFTDQSAAARGTVTAVGGAQVDTGIKAFGTGSIELEVGRNDGVSVNDHADWTLGTSSWTIELFAYHLANNVTEQLVSHYNATGNQRGWQFAYTGGGTDTLQFLASSDGTSGTLVAISGAWTPTINTWYYYCVQRSGNSFAIYAGQLGGSVSLIGSGTNAINIFNANPELRIGMLGNAGEGFMGYVDEFRMTASVARCSTGSVPTAAFPRS
jgi:hypothetical protein